MSGFAGRRNGIWDLRKIGRLRIRTSNRNGFVIHWAVRFRVRVTFRDRREGVGLLARPLQPFFLLLSQAFRLLCSPLMLEGGKVCVDLLALMPPVGCPAKVLKNGLLVLTNQLRMILALLFPQIFLVPPLCFNAVRNHRRKDPENTLCD